MFQVSCFKWRIPCRLLQHETCNLKLETSPISERGQALLELAIFGSMIILILGAMLNYGLNAEYTQRAMMESFRQAEAAPNTSYLLVQDRHIPNPSHPYAVGALVPVTASASVTRSNQLNTLGAPTLTMKINDDTRHYTLAKDPCEGPFLSEEACRAVCRTTPTHWACDKLDRLFADTRAFGLQPTTDRTNRLTTTLTQQADTKDLTATTQADWNQQIKRTVVRWDSATQTVVRDDVTTTPKNETKRTIWTTPW